MVGPSCIMHSALLRLQLLLIQTTAEATPPQTTTPAESLTEGLVRGWPADGSSEEWYKCNKCGWLPSTVGGVVQTMPQNHLGLTWHEACFWWCDQEPECVTAWHRKSGNHCSLYNFALPFDANNHPSSHMYVKPTPVHNGYVGITSGTCASNGYFDILDEAECRFAAIEVGFVGENANYPEHQTEDDRPHGCRRQTFGPALWINDKPNSPTTASDVHSVVCKAECSLNEASGCEKCAHVAWAQGKTVKDACYNCDCGEVFGRQCGCVHCDNEPQNFCSNGWTFHGDGRCENDQFPLDIAAPEGFSFDGTYAPEGSMYHLERTTLEYCGELCLEQPWCAFFSWKAESKTSAGTAWCYISAHCELFSGDNNGFDNDSWKYDTYIITGRRVRWSHVGYGGCTGGNWRKIGTAGSLDEAKALMLADDQCNADGSMLFYSAYSYDSSLSVRR